jgi:hypothetical protein
MESVFAIVVVDSVGIGIAVVGEYPVSKMYLVFSCNSNLIYIV